MGRALRSKLVEKASQRRLKRIRGPSLAFPHDERGPSCCLERLEITRISCLIPLELRPPIFRPGLRHLRAEPAVMLMPETAMDEDDLATRREHNVRVARQVGAVQAIAIAERVQDSAHDKL